MTNPVVLYGTQSNGETLPVQVDATGRLVAEGLQGEPGEKGDKGDQGDPGPQGPPGEPGTGGGGDGKIPTEKPANPVNGDLWLNTIPCPAILNVWTECPAPGHWMEYENIPLLLLGPPTLIGSGQVSQILTLQAGSTEGGEPPYTTTYQFVDQNDVVLQDGGSNEYLMLADDEGRTISGTFTVTDSRGTVQTSEKSGSIGPIDKAPWTAEVDFVIVGGGGSAVPHGDLGYIPGGGGGYLSSMTGERSGGDTDPLPKIAINDQTASNAFTISIGGVDEDTTFSGLGVTRTALAGGSDGPGASGSGGRPSQGTVQYPGTAGQGFGGSNGGKYPFRECEQSQYHCDPDCRPQSWTGGAGGSGSAADGMNGGDGTPSIITGEFVFRAGGGAGRASCGNSPAPGNPGMRPGNPGQGGSTTDDAQGGVVILSMPEFLDFQRTAGNWISTRSIVSGKSVVQITSGFGEGRFVIDEKLFREWLKATHNDFAY